MNRTIMDATVRRFYDAYSRRTHLATFPDGYIVRSFEREVARLNRNQEVRRGTSALTVSSPRADSR